MDASVLITVLFIAMAIVVIYGLIHYLKKAHSITSSGANNSDLLASVQKTVTKAKRIKEEK